MSLTPSYEYPHNFNNEETCSNIVHNDDDSDYELTDDGGNQSKSKLDFNYSIKNLVALKKMSENTRTKPQNLQEMDKLLKLNKHTDDDGDVDCDSDMEKSALENSPQLPPSWRHYDRSLGKDVYTIAATQTMPPISSLQITSIDGFFNRKRGRPTKNYFVEVYKNIHQKPQAVFTSFKLEKQQPDAATIRYENPMNNSLQRNLQGIKDCEHDNKSTSVEYPRQKHLSEISTYRKRFRNNMHLFMNSSDEPIMKSNQINAFENLNIKNMETSATTSVEIWPELKKFKSAQSTKKATVIRAAGTFYPENSNGKSEYCKNVKDELTNLNWDKQSSCETDVAQNLSLKDTMQENDANCSDTQTPISPISSLIAGCSSALQQIYNVLQTQQQLFAFYRQLFLMIPAIYHSDQKHPIYEHTTASPLSLGITDSETSVLPNNSLLNLVLNMQSGTKTEDRLRSLRKATATTSSATTITTATRTTTSATTAATEKSNTVTSLTITKDTDRSQNTTISIDISSGASYRTERKIIKRHFQSEGERPTSDYIRFRFNEDCCYETCNFRWHQSHFHCVRSDCQYSFSDKTRFVQHTARHDRLDKVAAHRRRHNKMEFIRLAGFRMVTSNENCTVTNVASNSNTDQSPDEISSFIGTDKKSL